MDSDILTNTMDGNLQKSSTPENLEWLFTNYASSDQVMGRDEIRDHVRIENINTAFIVRYLNNCKANKSQLLDRVSDMTSDPHNSRIHETMDEEKKVHPPPRKAKGDFFKLWSPWFASMARLSEPQPVPSIGTIHSSKEEVDTFYKFWYAFTSRRQYNCTFDNNDDVLSTEKKVRKVDGNRAIDKAKLLKIVEEAMRDDPRLAMFREARNAMPQNKEKYKAAEAEAEEDARKVQEEAEKEEQEAKDAARRLKEVAKNAKKKSKRSIRNSVKLANYFSKESTASAAQIDQVLFDVDVMLEQFDDLQLQQVSNEIKNVPAVQVKSVLITAAKSLVSANKVAGSSFKYFDTNE